MNENKPTIAIVGATGLVGAEMLAVLEERTVTCGELRLLASKDSVGEVYKFRDTEAVVQELNEDSFVGVDFALFATSTELSKKFVPVAVKAGAWVIDNSSAFRMDPEVPLVVPEVNFESVSSASKIIANPNCSTIQLIPVLKAIHKLVELDRVVVSTYQSVSGAGKDALDELWAQTLAICNQSEMPQTVFEHQIAFNCIPQIDTFAEDGYTGEELKIINETRKILTLPELNITATAVRVPVFYCHAESVNISTKGPISVEALIAELGNMPGVEVLAEPGEFPMQINVGGSDQIMVGRIRPDRSVQHGVALWVVADNVRKGAALNAVQILERLLECE